MSKARILIVEDEYVTRLDLKVSLEALAYTVVGMASNMADAVQRTVELHPDLVLMDIRLQGKEDGIEAAAKLREKLDVPVIYLTAYADDTTLARARQTGAYGYILKPFDETALKATVETALERFRLDRKLREEEQWLVNLVGSIGDAVLACDGQGKVVFLNPVAESLTGWRREQAFGHDVEEVFRLADRETQCPFTSLFVPPFEGRTFVIPSPSLLLRRGGSPCLIDNSAAPMRTPQGESAGLVIVFRDISERQRLADALRQMHKMEAVSRLAGGVAHDFNNLLTVILGYCEQARLEKCTTDFHRDALQAIAQAGQRAAGLTRQLLAFSRKQVLNQQVVDLNDFLVSREASLRRLLGDTVSLRLEPASVPLPISGDELILEQILTTLATNAREAMNDGDALHLGLSVVPATKDKGRRARLTIRDTGCGMTPDIVQHLFEPYFTTKEQGRGTGLGLASVYGAIKQHQGTIEVVSELGIGTTFIIDLPLVEQPEVSSLGPIIIARRDQFEKLVLLVEDEAMVRELARVLLTAMGCRILEAASAEEALRLSSQTQDHIDLLLTDVMMPGMNGPMLYEAMVQQRPGLPVLYMSGYTFGTLEEMGILKPGTHLLSKPFSVAELMTHVQERLASAK